MKIKISKPHPGQLKIIKNLSRFNVIRCGRRFGKTRLGAFLLLGVTGQFGNNHPAINKGILTGHEVAWVAPSYKYLLEAWKYIRSALEPIETSHSTQDKRIEYITGGSLEFWSADRGDVARSRKYAQIVIDEAAKIKNLYQQWNEDIRAALSDYQGAAYFMSTPKGMNDFKTIWDLAEGKDWSRHKFPTWENPYINSEEIDALRKSLPRLVFMQEIEAEFVETGGMLIKPEYLQFDKPPERENFKTIVMGVDLAISKKDISDYTAIVIAGLDLDGRIWILHADRARVGFFEAVNFIKNQYKRFQPNMIVVEKVAYQQAMIEALSKERLPVFGVVPVKDKVSRFMPLLAQYEQNNVFHSINIPEWFNRELLAFPESDHDDAVDASVYAYTALPTLQEIQVG